MDTPVEVECAPEAGVQPIQALSGEPDGRLQSDGAAGIRVAVDIHIGPTQSHTLAHAAVGAQGESRRGRGGAGCFGAIQGWREMEADDATCRVTI